MQKKGNMSDSFDSYLNKLTNIERGENVIALKNLCKMEKPILSYFRNIWQALQNIINDNEVDSNFIEELRSKLFILSSIKSTYESLKNETTCNSKEEIEKFQHRIDNLSLYNCCTEWEELKILAQKIKDCSNEINDTKPKQISLQDKKTRILWI